MNSGSPAPRIPIEKLGERYEVILTSLKKWSVGAPSQAPPDALEILLERSRFAAVTRS